VAVANFHRQMHTCCPFSYLSTDTDSCFLKMEFLNIPTQAKSYKIVCESGTWNIDLVGKTKFQVRYLLQPFFSSCLMSKTSTLSAYILLYITELAGKSVSECLQGSSFSSIVCSSMYNLSWFVLFHCSLL
jgi:hypothetical protein